MSGPAAASPGLRLAQPDAIVVALFQGRPEPATAVRDGLRKFLAGCEPFALAVPLAEGGAQRLNAAGSRFLYDKPSRLVFFGCSPLHHVALRAFLYAARRPSAAPGDGAWDPVYALPPRQQRPVTDPQRFVPLAAAYLACGEGLCVGPTASAILVSPDFDWTALERGAFRRFTRSAATIQDRAAA